MFSHLKSIRVRNFNNENSSLVEPLISPQLEHTSAHVLNIEEETSEFNFFTMAANAFDCSNDFFDFLDLYDGASFALTSHDNSNLLRNYLQDDELFSQLLQIHTNENARLAIEYVKSIFILYIEEQHLKIKMRTLMVPALINITFSALAFWQLGEMSDNKDGLKNLTDQLQESCNNPNTELCTTSLSYLMQLMQCDENKTSNQTLISQCEKIISANENIQNETSLEMIFIGGAAIFFILLLLIQKYTDKFFLNLVAKKEVSMNEILTTAASSPALDYHYNLIKFICAQQNIELDERQKIPNMRAKLSLITNKLFANWRLLHSEVNVPTGWSIRSSCSLFKPLATRIPDCDTPRRSFFNRVAVMPS